MEEKGKDESTKEKHKDETKEANETGKTEEKGESKGAGRSSFDDIDLSQAGPVDPDQLRERLKDLDKLLAPYRTRMTVHDLLKQID